MEQLGVPAGQVRTVPEVFESSDTLARGLVQDVPDPVHGTLKMVASPLRFSDTPVRFPVAPPRLGEHSHQVLQSVLGLESSEIADLVSRGIVRAGGV
jgi:hypothetical protein